MFLASGITHLLRFLSETDAHGDPLHDIDLYRTEKGGRGVGKRLIGSGWGYRKPVLKKRAVERFSLEHTTRGDGRVLRLEIDQVNMYKGSLSPARTYGRICVLCATERALRVGNLVDVGKPPLSVTLHNGLRYGTGQVVCYVLRREVFPVYKDGILISDQSTCDGRFRDKLHLRTKEGVTLCALWQPGPVVPPVETFKCPRFVEMVGHDSRQIHHPGVLVHAGRERDAGGESEMDGEGEEGADSDDQAERADESDDGDEGEGDEGEGDEDNEDSEDDTEEESAYAVESVLSRRVVRKPPPPEVQSIQVGWGRELHMGN